MGSGLSMRGRTERGMEQEEFKALLSSEGFEEVAVVAREPNGRVDEHVHTFEAKALILDGEIRLRIDEGECVYQPGQVFHILPSVPHTEWYGPVGVKYLVGRK